MWSLMKRHNVGVARGMTIRDPPVSQFCYTYVPMTKLAGEAPIKERISRLIERSDTSSLLYFLPTAFEDSGTNEPLPAVTYRSWA